MDGYTFQLPAKASSLDQINAVIKILEQEVPSTHKKGIQLLGLWPNDWVKNIATISQNIRRLPLDYALSLHAPISPMSQNDFVDLRTDTALQTMSSVCTFAEEHNIGDITIHTNSTDNHQRHCGQDQIRSEKLRIINNLSKLSKEYSSINLSLENLPAPLMGDNITDPNQMPHDFFMTTDLSILDFARDFAGIPNLGFCIDIYHYQKAKSQVDYLIQHFGANPDSSVLKQFGCSGIGVPLSPMRDLNDLALEIKSLDSKIFDCQLTGYDKSVWFPHNGLLREGSEINDTFAGKEILSLIKNVRNLFGEVNFSLDMPCTDYITRKEQITSMRYILEKL
jgi:sugar phosphate isomerase/epimerase